MSSLEISHDAVYDADVRKRVGIALAFTRRPALSRIGIEDANGEVTLHGEVPSQLHRDLAIEIVKRVAGVRRVHVDLALRKDAKAEVPADAKAAFNATAVKQLVTAVLFSIVAAFSATGCNKADNDRVQVFPVNGQLQWNGKPLAEAFVVFHPRESGATAAPAAHGQTDQEGKFRLTTYEAGDGAAVGEYAVTVQHYELIKSGDSYSAGPNVLPKKIADPTTTNITIRIAAGANQLEPIEIQRR